MRSWLLFCWSIYGNNYGILVMVCYLTRETDRPGRGYHILVLYIRTPY